MLAVVKSAGGTRCLQTEKLLSGLKKFVSIKVLKSAVGKSAGGKRCLQTEKQLSGLEQFVSLKVLKSACRW